MSRPDLDAIEAKFRGQGSDEDGDLVRQITAIVRKADEEFERVGGSSRHWVRDCFLSFLDDSEFILIRAAMMRSLIAYCRRLEAVVEVARAIASTAPPDDWERYDVSWGDYMPYGEPGDPAYVDSVDPGNKDDVHSHGWYCGHWSAAKDLRPALAALDKEETDA